MKLTIFLLSVFVFVGCRFNTPRETEQIPSKGLSNEVIESIELNEVVPLQKVIYEILDISINQFNEMSKNQNINFDALVISQKSYGLRDTICSISYWSLEDLNLLFCATEYYGYMVYRDLVIFIKCEYASSLFDRLPSKRIFYKGNQIKIDRFDEILFEIHANTFYQYKLEEEDNNVSTDSSIMNSFDWIEEL